VSLRARGKCDAVGCGLCLGRFAVETGPGSDRVPKVSDRRSSEWTRVCPVREPACGFAGLAPGLLCGSRVNFRLP
jgi:hypothetical protein